MSQLFNNEKAGEGDVAMAMPGRTRRAEQWGAEETFAELNEGVPASSPRPW